jgi:hypothetical protein
MGFATEGAAPRSGPVPHGMACDVKRTTTAATVPVLTGVAGRVYPMRSVCGCATFKIHTAPPNPRSPVLVSAPVLLAGRGMASRGPLQNQNNNTPGVQITLTAPMPMAMGPRRVFQPSLPASPHGSPSGARSRVHRAQAVRPGRLSAIRRAARRRCRYHFESHRWIEASYPQPRRSVARPERRRSAVRADLLRPARPCPM